MSEMVEFIQNNISTFDLIVFLITLYSMLRSATKGFMLSLLSFSKWLLALIITIILVPKLNPLIENYIESEFIADVGLGIFVYITSLFIALSEDSAIKSKKNLKYLVAESQTPGGLNEQGVKELKKTGYYKSLEKSLNSILKRLNKV